DPHGDPIPADDGTMTRRTLIPLTELAIGATGIVAQLKTESAEMIQHMLDRGFSLGTEVTLIEQDPFDGPVHVQLAGSDRVIGHHVARCIYVECV
ncbi:MAG: ferrous iron transport protein A, partial [Anaerolinea sp.]|nr:ferrous iron transport protein A [Anaerolinea sp.]